MSSFKVAKERRIPSRRKHIRFNPDFLTVAFIDLEESDEDFEPQFAALVINQSYQGVALATRAHDALKTGTNCFVKVGDLAPLRAEIIWCTKEDSEVYKVGVKFLD